MLAYGTNILCVYKLLFVNVCLYYMYVFINCYKVAKNKTHENYISALLYYECVELYCCEDVYLCVYASEYDLLLLCLPLSLSPSPLRHIDMGSE